jgi:hypothetical protein
MTHMRPTAWISICIVLLSFVVFAPHAAAQNWSFDARMIALGGVAGSGNLAHDMIDRQRPYTVIPLPFGLVQVLKDFDIYNPDSPKFDPIRAVEYASSPIHYIFGRDENKQAQTLFVSDLRNATLSRDLSRYQGFVPTSDLLAEGLAKPLWGGTIKFHRSQGGSYSGIYLGAGPYLSLTNHSSFDQQLLNVLSTGVNAVNAVMPIANADTAQAALAAVVGYRGRFGWSGVGPGVRGDGVYIAANFNYLRGFAYENDVLRVNLATDRTGLISSPASNIDVVHQDATKGTGYAIDVGVGAVVDRLEIGVAANGLANRIDWTGITQTAYRLPNLLSGNSSFLEGATTPVADTRVELPIDFRANVTYNGDGWLGTVEAGHGFGGAAFRAGLEQRFGAFEARGGVRYTFGMWNPAGGIGIDLTRKVSLDLALFSAATNIERKRQAAIAASIRINHFK